MSELSVVTSSQFCVFNANAVFDNCVIYGSYLDEFHTFLREDEYRILCFTKR